MRGERQHDEIETAPTTVPSEQDKRDAIARKLRAMAVKIESRPVDNLWHLEQLADETGRLDYLIMMATL